MVVGAPEPGRTTLVAIDGLMCAGKSTLARQVAGALPDADVVTLDDFYRHLSAEEQALGLQEGYRRYFDWERVLREVLIPLRDGSGVHYRRYDWVSKSLAEWRDVEPREVVLVEGVYSTRPELRPYFGATVYVSTPRETRLARLAERGYPDQTWVEHWMAVEDWYVQREKPATHAQLVVRGW
jgi:uridine kinase